MARRYASLIEFQRRFPDEASCALFLFERRWPDGFSGMRQDGAEPAEADEA